MNSPEHAQSTAPFPSFVVGDEAALGGVFRMLRPDGTPAAGVTGGTDTATAVDDQDALAIWQSMARLRVIDTRMLGLQRQGRIGFYGPATGQEASVIGAAHALQARDWIHPALREGGMALHRGYPLSTWMDHCLGNAQDTSTRGRQMPCHYGSRALGYVTLSSVMTTQVPQAVGTAYAMAMKHPAPDRPICFVALGDGATSEGDFHVAMNFAGVLKPRSVGLPLVIFCQNNGWAISTPTSRQCAAANLAVKAPGYGLAAARVDGNDALAVFAVMRAAAAHVRAGGTPVFIEAMTYRVGAHTTSDDPSLYRDESITEAWKLRDPLARLSAWLRTRGVLDEAAEAAWLARCAEELQVELRRAEQVGPPPLQSLFEDVYADMPPHLRAQHEAARAAAEPGLEGAEAAEV